jgi:hypothetical protein
MTNYPAWKDVRAGLVADAGGDEAIAEARRRNQAYIDSHRVAPDGRAAQVPRPGPGGGR